MGVSVSGLEGPHLHSPCPQCGFATWFKQFGPMRCACNTTYNTYCPEGRARVAPGPCRPATGHDGKLTCLTHRRETP